MTMQIFEKRFIVILPSFKMCFIHTTIRNKVPSVNTLLLYNVKIAKQFSNRAGHSDRFRKGQVLSQ
jgi:hypothetical protein